MRNTIFALCLALSLPALAAHERLFLFPSTAAGANSVMINVLQVITIAKLPQPDGTVVVQLTVPAAQPQAEQFEMVATFANDTDAQAFVDLWRARIEDAR